MKTQTQAEREAFEADAGPYGYDLRRANHARAGLFGESYADDVTENRWLGWAARAGCEHHE